MTNLATQTNHMNASLPSAYSASYWELATFLAPADVLIIGAGIVGLSAALSLKEKSPDLNILVLERGPLPSGASTRNAGFACFGSMSELLDDMNTRPEAEVWDLVQRRYTGLARLRHRIGDAAMDYQQLGGFELFKTEEAEVFEQCMDHLDHFNKKMKDITGLDQTYVMSNDKIARYGLGGIKYLIHNQAEGQIHTGKMMSALMHKAWSAGIRIIFGIEISHIESSAHGAMVQTSQGWDLQAREVLVATNGFARRLMPQLPVVPARNQVLITHPVAGLKLSGCFHYDRGYYYFRNIDGRILLGGGRILDVEGETTDELGTTPLIQSALEKLLREVVAPGCSVQIDRWWSGIMGIGQVKSPIIERVAERVTVAVRMGGMGVALGTLVGESAADLLIS